MTAWWLLVAIIGAVDPNSARTIAARNVQLLKDGEAALARGDVSQAMAKATEIQESDRRLDRLRWLLLRGQARVAATLMDDGITDLRAAQALLPNPDDRLPSVLRTIAGGERALGRFDDCATTCSSLATLATVATVTTVTDDDAMLWATCLRGTAMRAKAHDVLDRPNARPDVVRLRAQIRLEDGLPRLARIDVSSLLPSLSATDMLSLATDFDAAGDGAGAASLLELAHSQFPDDGAVQSAWVKRTSSASAVSRASLVVAGDGLRDRGDVDGAWRALLTATGPARWRQRTALLVDDRSWERVRLLGPRLRAASAIDDDMAYALAFAAFSTSNFDEAEQALSMMTGAAGFAQATALRAAMANARTQP